MPILYLDCETLPSSQQWIRDDVAKGIKHPGNMKKPETIEKWEKEQKPAVVDEALIKTALDTSLAEIFCIGVAVGDGCPWTMADREEHILLDFFHLYEDLNSPRLVGHNILGYDLPLIYHRAIINNVPIPPKFPRPNTKPWEVEADDTMVMWSGMRDRISLDRLSKLFGFDGKDGITGADVYPMYLEGKHDEILKYCEDDIKLTRQVYKRISGL